MSIDREKESQIVEYFLKSFEEKTPFDYDILDSMVNGIRPSLHPFGSITWNNLIYYKKQILQKITSTQNFYIKN